MTPFSPFDKRLLEEGLGWFDRPRLASLLESLGPSRFERIEALVTMLRHSSSDEFAEAADLFERAVARAGRDREALDDPAERRPSRSAERRSQRRRPS